MAALLRFAPRHGAVSSAAAIARLRNVVQATLDRQAQSRRRRDARNRAGRKGRLSVKSASQSNPAGDKLCQLLHSMKAIRAK